MSDPILQKELPSPPWLDPAVWRLPGVQPLPPEDWLIRDDAFAQQMAHRDQLIAKRESDVHALLPDAFPAAQECYDLILEALAADNGYVFQGGQIVRPDGVTVHLDRQKPLLTLGRLLQADVCLMQEGPKGHELTGAILCFPAHWTLSEKIGRSLPAIHGPVAEYDPSIEKRVQRLFDAMRADQVLWRANAILYEKPDLYTPKSEAQTSHATTVGQVRFVRSERQCLRRLPKTRAIVFTIHTYMVPIENLNDDARASLHILEKGT